MKYQSTWIPVPQGRAPKVKVGDAMKRADKLIDWYTAYNPEVRRLVVATQDYSSFEASAGKGAVVVTEEGLRYRGFLIVSAPSG